MDPADDLRQFEGDATLDAIRDFRDTYLGLGPEPRRPTLGRAGLSLHARVQARRPIGIAPNRGESMVGVTC